MADPHTAYYYYYYRVFATISTHFKDGTCNIKLGNHRKENIQKRRKIEVKIGAFGSNHLESSKKLLSI
jgi:hypothetical protein